MLMKHYILRTNGSQNRSLHDLANQFSWEAPEGPQGPEGNIRGRIDNPWRVSAPDWDPAPNCGHGLHGALSGEGDGGLLSWDPESLWLVCEVDAGPLGGPAGSRVAHDDSGSVVMLELQGKVKFKTCLVHYVGAREGATQYLAGLCPHAAIIGGTATAGDGGTATAGDGGTATAGYGGTATAGSYGTATAGNGGVATAGSYGIIQIKWWDDSAKRYRLEVGYIGEGGLEPNVPYKHEFQGGKASWTPNPAGRAHARATGLLEVAFGNTPQCVLGT